MKKSAKVVSKYEGKKSQVSYSNVLETLNVFCGQIAAENFCQIRDEWGNTVGEAELNVKIEKIIERLEKKFAKGFKTDDKFHEVMSYLFPKKKKKKK